MELRYRALTALQAADPADKLQQVGALTSDLASFDPELPIAGQPGAAQANTQTPDVQPPEFELKDPVVRPSR